MEEDYASAKEYTLKMASIFGEGNFYLELQDHGIDVQHPVNQGIMRLARETGLPLVVTNDAHYLRKEDATMQDVLLCIQTGKTVDEPNRMKFETEEFYLKSADEMQSIFSKYPEAIENTVRIAEKCNYDFEFGRLKLPTYVPEDGSCPRDFLKKLTYEGYEKKKAEFAEQYKAETGEDVK
jgi:DNA polymerase-3 subunit alpha